MTILRYIVLVFICILNFTITYSQNSILEDLFNRGIELYDAKKYNEAKKSFGECLAMVEANNFRIIAYIYLFIGDCDIALKRERESIIAYIQGIDFLEKDLNKGIKENELYRLYIYKIIKGLLSNAQNRLQSRIYDKTLNSLDLADNYCKKLEENILSDKNVTDKDKQSLEETKKYLKENRAFCLLQIGQYYSSKGKNLDAARMYRWCYDIAESISNKNDVKQCERIESIALLYAIENYLMAIKKSRQKKYKEATEYWKEAYDFSKKIKDRVIQDSITLHEYIRYNYINSLIIYTNELSESDNHIEATNIWQQIISLTSELKYNSAVKNYIGTLYAEAFRNYDRANYKEALYIAQKGAFITTRKLGEKSLEYVQFLNLLSSCCIPLGNYEESIHYAEKAFNIQKEFLEVTHPFFFQSYINLTATKILVGDFIGAISICEQGLKIIKDNNIQTSYKTLLLSLMADIFLITGRLDEALAINASLLHNADTKTKGRLISQLAIIELMKGNDASTYYDQALQILRDTDGEDHPLTASLKNEYACYMAKMKDYRKALKLEEEAMKTYKKKYGDYNSSVAVSLLSFAEIYANMGNDSEALKYAKCGIEMKERTIGKNSFFMINNYVFYANLLYKLQDVKGLTHLVYRTTNKLGQSFSKYLKEASVFERESIWNNYSKWYKESLYKFVSTFPNDSLCISAYNGTLMSKGLLLNSEIELKKILNESGDSIVSFLYNEVRMNRSIIRKLYPDYNSYKDKIDSLENVVNLLDRQLVKKSKAYGDYTKNLQINWRDVQNTLGDDDLAIEFCSFHLNSDSTMYIALVLNKNMSCPKTIPLFEEKQIKNIHDIYASKDASNFVWKPLAEYINKANNVYFGSSGELHNIAIENLPHWEDNCLMSDRWNIYRLSSTRELALAENKNDIHTATVYGGIKYDTNTTILTNDLDKDRNLNIFNTADSLNLRSGVTYLPSTLTEAKDIDKTLEMNNISSTLKTDTTATEGSFKSLSGKKINLMHIATHGFYWTEKEARFNRHMDFLMIDDKHQKYVEDKALTRSGLLFAGANNALKGMELPKDVNDGILTAQEIAHLDFRGLDLVVLSACQTGLGDIKGDGVFGLQRGFKKAGANTIMMTLWKVDDKATQILMSYFYNNLTSGKSKYDSLKLAQKKLRNYSAINDNGETYYPYNSPKYWAGFILLDALK